MPILKKNKPNKFGLNPEDFKTRKEYDKAYERCLYEERKQNKRKVRHNKLYNKHYKLKVNYNLNIQEYKKLMNLANYSCEVCGMENKEHLEKYNKPLFVDHNHKTGDIRGMLCSKCNLIEGHLDNLDMPVNDYIAKLYEYINKDSAYVKALNKWRKNSRKIKIVKLNRSKLCHIK